MAKKLLLFFLAAVCLYLLAAATLAVAGLRDHNQPADVAVVFGNRVHRSGIPSPSLATRLDKAVEIYNAGLAPAVLVSGGFGREGWDEAEVMAAYLIERGIPEQAVFIDRQGNNTYLTALNTAELAEINGWRSFILVSHFYHLPRARLVFDRFGLSPTYFAHADRFVFRDFYFGLMREVIAYPAYLFRSYEF
jgi:uncharacterized SAM-binding protein YcdF (DUF218 family)